MKTYLQTLITNSTDMSFTMLLNQILFDLENSNNDAEFLANLYKRSGISKNSLNRPDVIGFDIAFGELLFHIAESLNKINTK